jgi:hypothetical protein
MLARKFVPEPAKVAPRFLSGFFLAYDPFSVSLLQYHTHAQLVQDTMAKTMVMAEVVMLVLHVRRGRPPLMQHFGVEPRPLLSQPCPASQ